MNTENNQRSRLSKMLFKNALMDLLKEKGSVAKISVRELCDRAQLNRSTFYAHYNEPNDLLAEIENELLEATEEHLKKIGAETLAGINNVNGYILSFILNGSTGVIIQWMRSDYAASEKEIVNLLFAVNKGALSNLDGRMQ